MDNFEHGKVYGIEDLEDSDFGVVFKLHAKRIRKSPKMAKGCNFPGKIITINRDCSKCAKEIKLQVGSDLVFLDGKPFLLPAPVGLVEGEVVASFLLINCLGFL